MDALLGLGIAKVSDRGGGWGRLANLLTLCKRVERTFLGGRALFTLVGSFNALVAVLGRGLKLRDATNEQRMEGMRSRRSRRVCTMQALAHLGRHAGERESAQHNGEPGIQHE